MRDEYAILSMHFRELLVGLFATYANSVRESIGQANAKKMRSKVGADGAAVAHLVYTEVVGGSNPSPPIFPFGSRRRTRM